MRRDNAPFWGTVLILAGLLILLDNLGLFGNISVWAVGWPLFLVVLGLWLMWRNFLGRRYSPGRTVSGGEASAIPLQGARRARLRLRHGAGRLSIQPGASPEELLAGTFGGGMEYQARRDGEMLEVELRMRGDGGPWTGPWNWGGPGSLDWDLRLNADISLEMDLETGASDSRLDLSGLQVVDLRLRTGASSTELTLPARAGHAQARVEAGAASLRVHIPAGVPARIRTEGGLSDISVDGARFPYVGDMYASPDFDTAAHRVDLMIRMGLGSVVVG